MRPLSVVLLAIALVLPSAPVAAQGATAGRIEGVVHDSLTASPLAGATLTVIQLAPARQYLSVTTDATGRYRADSLGAGRYSVGFATAFLDSLELQLPPREVTLAEGQRLRVDFATPSRTTLYAAACPGLTPARGRGAIVGQVLNADTDTPLRGADVVISWTDISLDLKAMKVSNAGRLAGIKSDSLGQFRVCGVPTESYIAMQVQHGGRSGTAVRATVREDAGVMVQNLSLSPSSAREMAANDADSLADADTVSRQFTGTAVVSGTVRDANGAPLGDAQLRVVDGASTARTDSAGRYVLGALPAGTQLLEIRRVGYLLGQRAVELRADQTVTQDIRLSRVVTLDSVVVVARRARVADFERRAAIGGTASAIFTEKELAGYNLSRTSDLFRGRILGFNLYGDGIDAKIRSTRGAKSLNGECLTNVVIDGFQHQEINLVDPRDILGIEVYRGASGAPVEYDSSCGVIVVWTKR